MKSGGDIIQVKGDAVRLMQLEFEAREGEALAHMAFVDDVVGLLVGPMFVTAEAMFMLGWNKPLLAEIERRAGPTVLRDMAKIVA